MKAGLSRYLVGEYVRKAHGEAAYWWRFYMLHENLVKHETREPLSLGGPCTLAASLGGRGVVRLVESYYITVEHEDIGCLSDSLYLCVVRLLML